MPARIHRKAMPPTQPRDNLIPTPRMKSGGMAKKDRRILTGPFKQCNLDTVRRDSALDGHSHTV